MGIFDLITMNVYSQVFVISYPKQDLLAMPAARLLTAVLLFLCLFLEEELEYPLRVKGNALF